MQGAGERKNQPALQEQSLRGSRPGKMTMREDRRPAVKRPTRRRFTYPTLRCGRSARSQGRTMARKRTPPPGSSIPVRPEPRFEPAKPEEVARLPTPAAGQLGFVCHAGDDHGSPVLQWTGRNGEVVWGKIPDGLLVIGDPAKATWIPQGWELETYPAGWTPAHLEAWFRYAVFVAQHPLPRRQRRDPLPWRDERRPYYPLPRSLVHHAYLIADHLQQKPPTPEAQVPTDIDGTLAALADLRRLLIAPSAAGVEQRAAEQENRSADTQPELKEREKEVLRALLALKADSERRAVSRLQVARKADRHSPRSSYNKAIAGLSPKGLIKTRRGPNGGVWLTAKGVSAAKALEPPAEMV